MHARNLIRMNRLDEAMDVLNFVPVEKAAESIFFMKQKIYARRNQPDSIHHLITQLEDRNVPARLIHDLHLGASKEYALLNNRKNQLY